LFHPQQPNTTTADESNVQSQTTTADEQEEQEITKLIMSVAQSQTEEAREAGILKVNGTTKLTRQDITLAKKIIEAGYYKVKSMAVPLKSRILVAFPTTWYTDPLTHRRGGQLAVKTGTMASVLDQEFRHSVQWLRDHGHCADHIKVGFASHDTIPPIGPGDPYASQAGLSAFANHALPNGTVIATSPLIHVPYNRYMFMFDYNYEILNASRNGETNSSSTNELAYNRTITKLRGLQIFLNYCFHHPESTLLLCPYGLGVNYINHPPFPSDVYKQELGPKPTSTSRVDGSVHPQANVGIRWARNFGLVHNDTLVQHGHVEDLYFHSKIQLAFDYVALRDIALGEALYLDYGPIWEYHWRSHFVHWKAVPNADQYMSAMEINYRYPDVAVRTEVEQKNDPYPMHLEIRCHHLMLNFVEDNTVDHSTAMSFFWQVKDIGRPCRILARSDDTSNQLYEVFIGETSNTTSHHVHDLHRDEVVLQWHRRRQVPRSAIKFFDRPGSSDVHLPNAFRHPIDIPEDMFPMQWRNKRVDYQQPTLLNIQ
jgi:hypothetical protein